MKDVGEVYEEYKVLQRIDRDNYRTFAKDTSHRSENRYSDILPYCKSAYVIKKARNGGDGYINANVIEMGGDKRYIATQGVLKNTVQRFWEMVFEELEVFGRVNVVMLTELEEMGREKCFDYVSTMERDVKECGEWYGYEMVGFQTKDGGDSGSGRVEIREMRLRKGGEIFHIDHFWMREWPDFGVPLAGKDGNEWVIERKGEGSNVVHCSAGVGRSGTFIALDWIRSGGGGGGGVYEIVKKMRESRVMMVQRFEQYEYLYKKVV